MNSFRRHPGFDPLDLEFIDWCTNRLAFIWRQIFTTTTPLRTNGNSY